MVLFGVPRISTYCLLENVLVDGSDEDPLSYEGNQARAILFDSYRRNREGYFRVRNKSGRRISGVIIEIWGKSVDDGRIDKFTYEEWRSLSNEFVEIIQDIYYRPSKEIPSDYEI